MRHDPVLWAVIGLVVLILVAFGYGAWAEAKEDRRMEALGYTKVCERVGTRFIMSGKVMVPVADYDCEYVLAGAHQPLAPDGHPAPRRSYLGGRP